MTSSQEQCGVVLSKIEQAKQHVAESDGPVRWYWLTWLTRYRDQLSDALNEAGVSVVEDLPPAVRDELQVSHA
jgi:hypothetical protein